MRSFLFAVAAFSLSASVLAQPQNDVQAPRAPKSAAPEAPTPKAPPAIVPPATPRREGQPVNVKVELTISDQHGTSTPLKKTVTVVTGDSMNGFIRSNVNYAGGVGNIPLNVDAEPFLLPDGKIRLHVNVEYDLPAPGAIGPSDNLPPTERLVRVTQIRESLALIVESGKSMIVAQSADPVSDRQVTIEVKATVLR